MALSREKFLIHLRKPWSRKDKREDPFWEFGSFGTAECHFWNVLHPSRAPRLAGAQLAFAQPGPLGTRLLFVTPPVALRRYRKKGLKDQIEVRWRPVRMPLRYDSAPLLIDSAGRTDFPRLKKMLSGISGSFPLRRFASKFRTYSHALPRDVGGEVLSVYGEWRRKAGKRGAATSWEDALPVRLDVEYDRRKAYLTWRKRAGKSPCSPRLRRTVL